MLLNISLPSSGLSLEPIIEDLFLRRISRQKAASRLNMCESGINRQFPKAFGLTFNQAKTIFPIITSSYWLLHRNVSVSDIAHRLDYGDLSSFGRCFHQLWSLSPKRFQCVYQGTTQTHGIAICVSRREAIRLEVVGGSATSRALRHRRILLTTLDKSRGPDLGFWVSTEEIN